MANISKGVSFYQGQNLTAADIMSAITAAILSNVGADDMNPAWTGVRLSEPSTPVDGDVWYDTSTQRLKVYFSRWYVIAPCSFDCTWRMASAVSVTTGIGVEVDPANVGRVRRRTNNSFSFVGSAKGAVSLGETGALTRLGVGEAAAHSAGAGILAQDFIKADSSQNGYWLSDTSMSAGTVYYGQALESIVAGATGKVWFWGPPILAS